MTNDDLSARLQRVYAALDATLETDMNKALPIVRSDARSTTIYQDFRGDRSDPEMENLAYSLIYNLANLRDHSRRWMVKNGHDAKQVDVVRIKRARLTKPGPFNPL